VTEDLDRAVLARLADVVTDATAAFDGYQHTDALQKSEEFFWTFCDDYIELVKDRAYAPGSGGDSARSALAAGLSVLLRLFAPFLPYVTEEVWSWWREGSIHQAAWPTAEELTTLLADNAVETARADQAAYQWATDVLFEVRKQRSEAKQPLKVPITSVTVTAEPDAVLLMRVVEADLRAALRVQAFETSTGEPRAIVVVGYEPAAT